MACATSSFPVPVSPYTVSYTHLDVYKRQALYMEDGLYYTNIKKLRNLYGQKLQAALSAFDRCAAGFVTPTNTSSGINMMLKVRTKKTPAALSDAARSIGVNVQPAAALTDQDTAALIFYYNQIPLSEMDRSISQMVQLWKN